MRTKKQKQKDAADFMAYLKTVPKERLSKAALYLLKHENDAPVKMDMKYVLK